MPQVPSRRTSAASSLLVVLLASTFFANSSAAQAPTAFDRAWQSGTPVSVTGVLTVVFADDFANRRSDLVHMIRDEKTGRSFQLRFEKAPPAKVRPGTVITVSGRVRGSEIYLSAAQTSSASPITSTQTAAQTPVVSGDQRTLVIVANFSDRNVSCSTSNIGNMMFTDPSSRSIDALYRETSFGQVSFSGTVVGPVTLPFASSDPCDFTAWANAATAAASSSVDVNAYARTLYVMPSSSCPAAGIAQVGITPSRAWVFTCDIQDVYAHELGHNLGMQHASTSTDEYGDLSDFMSMGFGFLRQVNAPHKAQMGWLPDSQMPVVTQNGSYNIAPLELDPSIASAPQSLKVFKADTNEYYYLSYRRGIGVDASLVCCSFLDRLNVHRWSGEQSYPGGTTKLVAALLDGQSFADPVSGFTVTQVSHTDAYTTAHVQLGNGCGSAAPTLTLSPPEQSGPPGTAVSYGVALVNNDPALCAGSTFALNGTVPSGWSGSVSPTSLQLGPGAAGTATLTVTSAADAASGTYNTDVAVADVNVPVHAGSTTGSYEVLASCTSAPAVSISPSNQSAPAGTKVNYAVTVTNRDLAGCATETFTVTPTVPAGWVATLSSSALNLAAGASGTVTYSVTSAANSAASTYGVWAGISDAGSPALNVLAGANYTVQGDTIAPTAPATLLGTLKRGQVTLSWAQATDNVGVAGYRVLRNGTVIATVTGLGWVDQAVVAGSTYTYSVVAYDAAGNVSASSNSMTMSIRGAKGR